MRTPGLLFCAALLACCGPAAAAPAPARNVVLISLNALRADHLKAYGYANETAPNISRLAGEGAVFEQVVAQSHWTLSSLASLFTSKYVHSHGLYERGQKLPAGAFTLASALKAAGYRTAAFTGGLDMSGLYGLNKGFDVYYDETGKAPMGSFREIMPKALAWLAANKAGKFFLFVDSYDIHPPFDKPWPGGKEPDYAGPLKSKALDYDYLRGYKDGTLQLSDADLAYINSRYDAGITYADGFVGELLSKLDELGLSTDTIVVFTAEHGEELGDHGSFDRFGQNNLYDEAVRVPLIVRVPAGGAQRVPGQAELIDIMPTVLDLLRLPVPAGVQGTSLAPALAGNGKDRDAYSEAGPGKWLIRSGGWKLISDGGIYQLFDLAADKGEKHDLAAENPDKVYALAQKLLGWRRATRTGRSPDAGRVKLTPDMKRKLKEAGYWRE